MSNTKEELVYDPIIMDPLEELFDRIHAARGGELLLVHVPNNMDVHPAKCLSVMKSKGSILENILPSIIRDIKEDHD